MSIQPLQQTPPHSLFLTRCPARSGAAERCRSAAKATHWWQMERPDPLRHWESSAWQRVFVLRWLYHALIRLGVWYVRFNGGEEQLWREAARHAPPSYRWFGRSLGVDELEEELKDWPPWQAMKERMRPDDKVWPFLINPWTLAMRAGYVVVRRGRPVTGVVTVVS